MKTKVLLLSVIIFGFYSVAVSAQTWEIKSSKSNDHIDALWFIDAQNGIALGFQGCYYKTSDGGESWIKQASFTSNYV